MQVLPQSDGQLFGVSPHAGWQLPLPQLQAVPQSDGQEVEFSLHWGWHSPSPHWQLPQSPGQLACVSPQPTWQSMLPQMQG
jgi:hypothetical protein